MLCLLQPGTWAKFLPEARSGVQPEARSLVRSADAEWLPRPGYLPTCATGMTTLCT